MVGKISCLIYLAAYVVRECLGAIHLNLQSLHGVNTEL
jgi:hypothetical protein